MKSKLAELFSVDLRSLAALRVGLGVFMFVDLVYRALDLEAMYTDFGILPRSELGAWGRLPHWSFHTLGGSLGFEEALFLVAGLVAIALVAGVQTRVVTVLAWAFTVSLQTRDNDIFIGADRVFRMLLFWSMFLPLGARWSVDAVRRGGKPKRDETRFTAATAAILLQVATIYVMTVVTKLTLTTIWRDLSAVPRSVVVDGITTPFGRMLRGLGGLLPIFSLATLLIEALVPLAAWSPVATPRLRTAAVLAMMAFHLFVLGGALDLGLFPEIMVVAWVPFLPAYFWDDLGPRMLARARRGSKLVDGLSVSLGALADRAAKRLAPPKGSAPAEPRRAPASVRWLASGVVLAVAALGAFHCAYRVVQATPPAATLWAADFLQVDQLWALYTGVPNQSHFIYAARLRDGSVVDLHQGGAPLAWKKPRFRSANNHWWKYQLNVLRKPLSLPPHLSGYLERAWDRDHPPEQHVAELDLVELEQRWRPEGLTRQRPMLISHRIFDGADVGKSDEHDGGSTDDAEGDQALERWPVGKPVEVVLARPADVAREAACSQHEAIDSRLCRFGDGHAVRPEAPADDDLLVPFVDELGHGILAPAPPGLDAAPARLRCSLVVHDYSPRFDVTWHEGGSWFVPRNPWPVGVFSDCRAP